MNRERYAVFPLPPDKTVCFVSHDTSFSLILSLSVKTEDFIHRVVVFQGFYFVLFHFGILGFFLHCMSAAHFGGRMKLLLIVFLSDCAVYVTINSLKSRVYRSKSALHVLWSSGCCTVSCSNI